MSSHQHRATCTVADCGRFWRENCADCAQEMADKHRRETGHPVEVTITDGVPMWEVRHLTRLIGKRRGW